MRARPACCEMLRITLRVCGGSLSIQSCKMAERGGGGEEKQEGIISRNILKRNLSASTSNWYNIIDRRSGRFFYPTHFFFFFLSIMSSCFIEYRSARQEPEIAS